MCGVRQSVNDIDRASRVQIPEVRTLRFATRPTGMAEPQTGALTPANACIDRLPETPRPHDESANLPEAHLMMLVGGGAETWPPRSAPAVTDTDCREPQAAVGGCRYIGPTKTPTKNARGETRRGDRAHNPGRANDPMLGLKLRARRRRSEPQASTTMCRRPLYTHDPARSAKPKSTTNAPNPSEHTTEKTKHSRSTPPRKPRTLESMRGVTSRPVLTPAGSGRTPEVGDSKFQGTRTHRDDPI